MIGQYLSNTNENATVSILQKFFGTKQGLPTSFSLQPFRRAASVVCLGWIRIEHKWLAAACSGSENPNAAMLRDWHDGTSVTLLALLCWGHWRGTLASGTDDR